MQAVKYIAALQYATQQLQKTVQRTRSIQSVSGPQQKPSSDLKESVLVLSRSRRLSRNGQHLLSHNKTSTHLEFFREKLLFRRIPITLSLLERNMLVLQKVRKRLQIKGGGGSNEAHALRTFKDTKREELVPNISPELASKAPFAEHMTMTTNVLSNILEDGSNQTHFPVCLVNNPTVQHSHGDSASNSTDKTSSLMPPTAGAAQSYEGQQIDLVSSHSALAAVPQAKSASRILRLLHAVESERRHLLDEKRSRLTKRIHRLEADLAHGRKEDKPITDKSKSFREKDGNEAHPETTVESFRRDLHDAYVELELLNRSLLARSFMSARLWKLLLDEDIWKGAIAHQQRLTNGEKLPRGGNHGTLHSATVSCVFPLLSMSILFSRIVLGTFRDYLEGTEVNKFAPRFTVSLPSVAWLRKKQQSVQEGTTKGVSEAVQPPPDSGRPIRDASENMKEEKAALFEEGMKKEEEEEEEDLLLSMIRQSSDLVETRNVSNENGSVVEASSSSHVNKPTQNTSKRWHSSTVLRWMPPRSAKVLPLAVKTLAMFSYTLPHLPTRSIARAGSAHEVLSLLSMLQHTATATLLMDRRNESVESRTLHTTLKKLENVMLTISRDLRDEIVQMLQEGGDTMPTQPPEQAARMIIEMAALHLLPLRDPSTLKLLNPLICSVFPELRTHTLHTLMEKSRQNGLLAFATRRHRLKLNALHGHAQAESFVLGTIIQQARLRHRQMAAALREAHLAEVHQRSVAELARALSAHDLIALLQILEGALSGARGPARLADPSLDTKRVVTAALLVAESLLVSSARGGEDGAPDLPLEDWARLWVTLLALRPVVERWREAARQGPHPAHGRSEALIVDAITEVAAHGVTAILAERLDGLPARGPRRQDAHQAAGLAADGKAAPSAQGLSIIGVGIRKWGENHENGRKYAAVERLSRQVEVLAKLLREVVLYDTSLRHELRGWVVEKREAFHREMMECFRTAQLLDDASERGLRLICFKL